MEKRTKTSPIASYAGTVARSYFSILLGLNFSNLLLRMWVNNATRAARKESMGKSKKAVECHVKPLVRACRTCDFFEDYTKNHNDVVGWCRRYPPKPILGDITKPDDHGFARDMKSHNFPWVHKDCWCGEYSKRGSTTTNTGREAR